VVSVFRAIGIPPKGIFCLLSFRSVFFAPFPNQAYPYVWKDWIVPKIASFAVPEEICPRHADAQPYRLVDHQAMRDWISKPRSDVLFNEQSWWVTLHDSRVQVGALEGC
jgi:hypothetical protein